MNNDDLKRMSELLTELRWHVVTFTSFLPEGSKERKPFTAKLKEIERLRCICEQESAKCGM